jgi:arylsulfatase A-like enzyme
VRPDPQWPAVLAADMRIGHRARVARSSAAPKGARLLGPILGAVIASTIPTVMASGASELLQPARAEDLRPNILLILADDLGIADLGAFGSEIHTPVLDRLGAEGIRFTDFRASPACSPTRAMLLTGVDNHLAGLGNMAEELAPNQRGRPGYEGELRPDVATVAEILRGAGYATMMAGKWHLGFTPDAAPARRGFDQSFALLNSGAGHFGVTPYTKGGRPTEYRRHGEPVSPAEPYYSSHLFAEKLIEFLRVRGSDSRPFFAYLSFTAPHFPLQAPQHAIDRYEGAYATGPLQLRRSRLQRWVDFGWLTPEARGEIIGTPADNWTSRAANERKRAERVMQTYAAMITEMDRRCSTISGRPAS